MVRVGVCCMVVRDVGGGGDVCCMVVRGRDA